jgi:hypothetical protein
MPFFFNHRITHDSDVRTPDHTKSKAQKTGPTVHTQSHKKKTVILRSTDARISTGELGELTGAAVR